MAGCTLKCVECRIACGLRGFNPFNFKGEVKQVGLSERRSVSSSRTKIDVTKMARGSGGGSTSATNIPAIEHSQSGFYFDHLNQSEDLTVRHT